MKQKDKYRIYVLGDIPKDLKARIIAAHAWGIMKAKEKVMSDSPEIKIKKS